MQLLIKLKTTSRLLLVVFSEKLLQQNNPKTERVCISFNTNHHQLHPSKTKGVTDKQRALVTWWKQLHPSKGVSIVRIKMADIFKHGCSRWTELIWRKDSALTWTTNPIDRSVNHNVPRKLGGKKNRRILNNPLLNSECSRDAQSSKKHSILQEACPCRSNGPRPLGVGGGGGADEHGGEHAGAGVRRRRRVPDGRGIKNQCSRLSHAFVLYSVFSLCFS